MSFKAQLDVAGAKNNVLDLSYTLKQETDATGRPSTITHGGHVSITIESTGDTKFFEWMCNSFEKKDGKITFMKRDSDATMKELSFKEGHLVFYNEQFNANSENPMTETFTISAREISVGNASHINEWAV